MEIKSYLVPLGAHFVIHVCFEISTNKCANWNSHLIKKHNTNHSQRHDFGQFIVKIAPRNFGRMHLPTGPTAVYHHHHHHHLAALQNSPPNPDWALNNNNNNNNSINNIKIGGGSGSNNSILDPPTSSGTNSPPGSNSSSSQDLWWTERLILEAQAEYPGELGKCLPCKGQKNIVLCWRTCNGSWKCRRRFLPPLKVLCVCVQFKS